LHGVSDKELKCCIQSGNLPAMPGPSLPGCSTSATFYPTYDGNGNVSEYINESGAKVAHFEYVIVVAVHEYEALIARPAVLPEMPELWQKWDRGSVDRLLPYEVKAWHFP